MLWIALKLPWLNIQEEQHNLTFNLTNKEKLQIDGFAVVDDVYTSKEVNDIINAVNQLEDSSPLYRRSKDLFAIRQFLKQAPETLGLIFSPKLTNLLAQICGKGYFVTKSIYFDKPEASNWFVAYHQDLTISVDTLADLPDFKNWTIKQDQFAVQPPVQILQNNFTLRIHLDDTNPQNGALKVIPRSHKKDVYRPDDIDWNSEREVICEVKQGGVMLMKPLLLHASSRTTNQQRRRVIHIEFSNSELPNQLHWAERLEVLK